MTNSLTILENQRLAPYAHTQAGGVVDYLSLPSSLTELQDLCQWATKQEIAIVPFGRLSNVVVRDGGIRGLAILLQNLATIRIDKKHQRIIADAGADLIVISEQALENGLSGLEWAAGIPGSVGGATFMNAGAYGGQMDLVVESVVALMPNGQLQTFKRTELEFGYRHSVFHDNQGIIVQVAFKLQLDDGLRIQQRMDDVNFKRANKQPLMQPSNGSVFKRPTGYFAGKLIMDSGLQGTRVGGVEVSRKHAGFMVNVDHGTGNDYEDLIHLVQQTVQEKYQVTLETEVRILGER